MADPASFAKLVPGFDFLQGLMKNAGGSLPAINQWIAPTLDPQELEKRIQDLRTVQFWLEQNAKMIAATVQALEVQRMTLATLKTMNLPMSQLRESMTLPPVAAPAPAPEPEEEPADEPEAAAAPAPAGGTAAVDPMQWWGALTQQFTELAANAMKDMPAAVAAAVEPAAAKAPAPAARSAKSKAKPAAKRAGKKAPAKKRAARPRASG